MSELIFPTDFDEKTTIAQDDYILMADSEDSNKLKKAKYSNLKGEKGDTGEQGEQGIQGEQGPQGPQGIQGVKGDTGAKGDTGDKGDTGASINSVEFRGNDMVFGRDDGETVTLYDAKTELKGDKGDTGEKGDPGENGANGANGLNGQDGASIVSAAFVNTDMVFTDSKGNTIALEGAKEQLRGPTGPAGAQGPDGQDGTDGASIVSGEFVGDDLVFTKDDTTTVTIADAKNTLKGPEGDEGPTGATGNGIVNATSTKSGKTTTVTLHYTNDDSDDFQVQDGADGQGDMTYSDFNITAAESGATLTITNLTTSFVPTANFTIAAGTALKEGMQYIVRLNSGATAYTMTLGTGITNPFGEDLTLTASKMTTIVMLATSSSTLEIFSILTAE